jgi:hypothetical protein
MNDNNIITLNVGGQKFSTSLHLREVVLLMYLTDLQLQEGEG